LNAVLPGESGAQEADAGWLYLATNFNAVVFGDFTASGGDSENRLAVGGTARFLGGYSVGMPVAGVPLPTHTDATTDILIAGGDLHDGVFGVNGNIVYGGTRTGPTRYYMPGGNVVEQVTDITFDASGNVPRDGTGATWEQLFECAAAASAAMAALADSGAVTKDFTSPWQRFLTGTNESLNVFNVTAAEWSMKSSQTVIDAPAGSTVLVNITGGETAITNSSIALVGVDRRHVIYNYVDAAWISTKSFLHPGSVLAPYASASLSGGAVDGAAVFGGDVTTTIGFEFHNFPYAGQGFGSVNEAPSAEPQSVVTAEDTAVSLTLCGTDPESGTLAFAVTAPPAHGTLAGAPPDLVYTPDANFNGADAFAFTVSDGGSDSPPATVSITVTPVNDAPRLSVLGGQTVLRGAPLVFGADRLISVSDADAGTAPLRLSLSTVSGALTLGSTDGLTWMDGTGDNLTNRVVQGALDALNAALNGLTYTPADVSGVDLITLTVDDLGNTGAGGSLTDTRWIPVVLQENAELFVDAGPDRILPWTNRTAYLTALVSARDLPADSRIATEWSVVSGPKTADFYNWAETIAAPQNGQPVSCAAWVTFSAPGEYVVRMTARSESTQAVDEVAITFIPPDDAPIVALCQSVVVRGDTPATFRVMGYAAQDHQLGFILADPPLHGDLDFVSEWGFAGFCYAYFATRDSVEFCYTPPSGFLGNDSFTFWVFDENGLSDATVWITVLPADGLAKARTVSLTTEQDVPARVYVGGLERDAQPLSFAVQSSPAHGTVSFDPFSPGSNAVVAIYSPAPGYVGNDRFVVEASDAAAIAWNAEVIVIVQPRLFTVNAGEDQFLDGPGEMALSGAVSIPSPAPCVATNILWTKRGGPGQVRFSDSGSLTTTASFDKSGSYTLELLAIYGGVQKSDLLTVVVASATSETPSFVRSSAGTDFWLAEMGNSQFDFFARPYPDLNGGESCLAITAETDTQGVVSWDTTRLIHDPDSGCWRPDPVTVRRNSRPFSVSAGARTLVQLRDLSMFISFYEFGYSFYPLANDAVSLSAIHVTANDPVSVFKTEAAPGTAGGYHALPTDLLGTNYWVMSYPNEAESEYGVCGGTVFAVVAPYDNTHVSITPACSAVSRKAGEPFVITLQSGEVYRLINENDFSADFTGTEIAADKPVAVFSGNRATMVPDSIWYADQLCEQMPPVELWGQRFLTLPFASRLHGDTFRFLAAFDGTEIATNGAFAAALDRGGVFECIIDGPCEIVARHPVLAVQFSNGCEFDGNDNAGPAMTIVPAVENYGTAYSFAAPQTDRYGWSGEFINFVNVIAPVDAVESLSLDGEPVDPALFQPISESGYCGAQLAVSGAGTLRSGAAAPFGAVAYGWDSYCAYAYPAGLCGTPAVTGRRVSLRQATPYAAVGCEKSVVARVTGDDGSPMPDAGVQFTVSGVHTVSGWGRTGQNGEASFTYRGNLTGVDQIGASLEAVRSVVTNTWLEAVSNQRPVISIAPVYHVGVGTWCDFTAEVTDDALPEGGGLSAVWRLDSGPAVPTLRCTGQASTAAFFEFPGVYVLELTVCDGELSTRAPVTVVVSEMQAGLRIYPTFDDMWDGTGDVQDGGRVFIGQEVWLEVRFTSSLTKEARVEFYDGGEKIAEAVAEWDGREDDGWEAVATWIVPDTTEPHELSAVVIDRNGDITRSQSIQVRVGQIKFTLHQFSPMAIVGNWKDVYAELTDEDGIPLKRAIQVNDSRSVDFSVAGVHVDGSFEGFDSNGEAYFFYWGTETGTDIIQAEYNGQTACVTNEWVAASENEPPLLVAPERIVAVSGVPFQPQVTIADDGRPNDQLTVLWRAHDDVGLTTTFSDRHSATTTVCCTVDDWVSERTCYLEVYVSDSQFCSWAGIEVLIEEPPDIQWFELVNDQSPLVFYLQVFDWLSDVFTVDLYEGDTLLQTLESDGHDYLFVDPPRRGNLVFTVRVTDESGLTDVSEPIYVTLGDPPTLEWVTPSTADTAFAGYPVGLSVDVADADGFVTNVTYYRKDGVIKVPIGQGAGLDFAFIWMPPAAGDYTLVAVATDNDGLRSTNVARAVTVLPPRVAGTITAPSDGDTVYAQTPLDIRLAISDPLDVYDHAEIFANGASLGVTQGAVLTWVPEQPGAYVITAEITDREGHCRNAENSVTVHVVLKQRPTLEWLRPAATDAVFAGYPVTLSVHAADSDGSVTGVTYYRKDGAAYVLLGQGTGPGFAFSWTPPAIGGYTLAAVATDNDGLVSDMTEHSVEAVAPWVKGTITAPLNGATVFVRCPLEIRLAVNDPAGLFDRAEVFANGVSLGVTQSAVLTWTPGQTGDYALTARIVDANGVVHDAENAVTVHVTEKPRPTVAITHPSQGSRVRAGVETVIVARLEDPAALTTNLLFYVNGECVGRNATRHAWTPAQPGSNTLHCVALTSAGQDAPSETVAVDVAEMSPPAVSLLSPTNTQRFASGSVPLVSAEAADPDGAVTLLTIVLDDVSLGEIGDAVLEIPAADAAPGWHSVYARATDSDGLSASSPVARFFVERAENPDLPVSAGLSAEALSASEIGLSWQSVATNDSTQGIVIERWNAAQSLWDELAQLQPAGTNHVDADLTPETNHRYRIACVDADGSRSAYSAEADATTRVMFRDYAVIDLTGSLESLLDGPAPGGNVLTNAGLTHFDSRRAVPLGARHAEAVLGTQAATLRQAAARFTETWPQIRLDFDPVLLSPQSVLPGVGYLTGPGGSGVTVSEATAQLFDPAAPDTPVKAFLQEHRDLFGFGPEALDEADVQRDYVSPLTGARTRVWQQQVAGVPVFNALFIGHVTSNAELAAVSCSFIPSPSEAAAPGVVNAVLAGYEFPVTGPQALLAAVQNAGDAFILADITGQSDAAGVTRGQSFTAGNGIKGEAYVELTWFPASRNELVLARQVIFTSRWRNEMILTLVSAQDGQILYRRNLTVTGEPATYRVYTGASPAPMSPGLPAPGTAQPAPAGRSLVTLAALDDDASPAGWIGDGVNETRGNNVDAHLDRDDDDLPDLPRPAGYPPRTFDFPLDPAAGPGTYGAAAAVQVFYWNNWMHDVLHALGFTEAGGNFQDDNFGRGGLDGDAVRADAQDGLHLDDGRHRDNANMSVPPDGYAPRMQMFVFGGAEPDRDGSLDADLILHEYTHGLSIRTVGGGAGIDALQTAGMGEGWSDFYALALLAPPEADPDAAYPVGSYVAYHGFGTAFDQNGYYGLRRYPYCTDTNRNPLTFADIDPAQASPHAGVPRNPLSGPFRAAQAAEVHNQGEVWCVTLWELRANLIRKHGHEQGNGLALMLVTEGMRLSPQNPTYVQARDAVLLADRMLSDGADAPEIWAAFAKRGLGHGAKAPYSYTTSGIRASREPPPALVVEQAEILDGDGVIGADESNGLLLTLRNQGTGDATGVAVQISTQTPGVEILQADAFYGDIPPGRSRANAAEFRILTGPGFVEGTTVELAVTVDSGQDATAATLLFYTGGAGPRLPSMDDDVLNAVATPGQAAMKDLTPFDLGNLEPLWMAEDASCLLKAAPGKYVLWRPDAPPAAMANPAFLAHRLTRHGVVVGELAGPKTTDGFGNVLDSSVGAVWIPGDPEPLPLTTGRYVYPKGAEVGEYVGLAYGRAGGQWSYLGGVSVYPALHSAWDLNASGLSAGAASVYLRPTDADGDGLIGTNEVSWAPTEWSQFGADGRMDWLRSEERTVSAGYAGSPARGVWYNALLVSAARFGPGAEWRWLGPLNNGDSSAFSLATLINDSGDLAGVGVDGDGVKRVFRWNESDGEFTLSPPMGVPRARLLGPGGVDAFPSAMNQAGDIAGYLNVGGSGGTFPRAVLWRAGEMEARDLGTLGAVPEAAQGYSIAYALNDSRQVVGTSLKTDAGGGSTVSAGALWQWNAAAGGAPGWEISDLDNRVGDPDWRVLSAVGIAPDGWMLAHAQRALRDAQGNYTGSELRSVLLVCGDLDIDSDNSAGAYGGPDRTDGEDRIEDDASLPGKIIAVNDGDSDGDGIPDFADGYDLDKNDFNDIDSAGDRFTPLVLELPAGIDLSAARLAFVYDASDPAGVTRTGAPPAFEPAPGTLRVWTKDAGVRRSGNGVADVAAPGDFVPSGAAVSPSALGFTAPPGVSSVTNTFYVEAVRRSAAPGDGRILVRLDPDGPGPLGWADLDAVRVTAVRIGLIPDYDRDGKIETDDVLQANKGKPFHFWINSDRDTGSFSEHPEGALDTDYPEQEGDNSRDNVVNGLSDLLDFTPVWLDLGRILELMPPEKGYSYHIRSEGVSFALTDLSRHRASDYLRTDCTKCGTRLDSPASSTALSPPVHHVETRTALSAEFLGAVRADHDKGVLMVEGDYEYGRMELEVTGPNGRTIVNAKCPVRFYQVEEMYRWVNLRSVAGGTVARPTDGTLLLDRIGQPDPGGNETHFVFVHGYNVSESSARAWSSEMFKRLYQSGMSARFTAVTWHGNDGQQWIPVAPGFGYRTPDYYANVCHAFESAPALSAAVASLPGETKVIAAHSLGNMLVSSAIQNCGMGVGKYFMLNAAVAAECYDANLSDTGSPSNPMVHEDWRNYHPATWSARWHGLFPGDARATLTWANRFPSVLPVAYNYYSGGDEVFELYNGTPWPAAGYTGSSASVGRYSWQKQELFKGRTASTDTITSWLTRSDQAGWGFRGTWETTLGGGQVFVRAYSADEANALTPDGIRAAPVFHPNPPELFQSSIPLADRARILAYGIPALSQAAGGGQVGSNEEPAMRSEVNMSTDILRPNGWWRPGYDDLDERWLHCDLREVAYYYVYPLFDNLVETGGLK
jgi:choice-of-anchor A domain-containing protein